MYGFTKGHYGLANRLLSHAIPVHTLFWKTVKEFPYNCAFSFSIGCSSATYGHIGSKSTKIIPLLILHISANYSANQSCSVCMAVLLVFKSVAIAPPMDVLGSQRQAFLLLPQYTSPPNMVQIGVILGQNDTVRWSGKRTHGHTLLCAGQGLAKSDFPNCHWKCLYIYSVNKAKQAF